MTVEQLLTEALQGADDFVPSPDLFAKVRRSIDEDAAHRRRVRRALTWAAAALAVAVAWVAAFLDIREGTATMPWWAVEVLTVAILVVLVVVLGPVIRRFGQALALEVFRSNRETSERFLALLDIAYYLVFSAFIVMTTNFSAQTDWEGTLAGQLGGDGELFRIGGLLLLMGILHTLTIAALPFMGLIFASNWRRAARAELGNEAPEPDPQAEKADRVATLIVWLVAAALAALALMFIVPGIIGAVLGAD